VPPARASGVGLRSAHNTTDSNGYTAAEPVAIYNTLAGNEQIVTGGRVTAADSNWNHQRAPRTAIGLTNNQHLILFVVDGRQPGISEGMSVPEVADLLVKDYGVVDALDLDGGGSTTLAIADPTPRIVNVPVGVKDAPGTQRAVGSNLALFALLWEPTTTARSAPAPATAPSDRSTEPWTLVAVGACLVAGVALVVWWRRSRRGR